MNGQSAVQLVLIDFLTGRFSTGHQEDYLRALEAALTAYEPTAIAPFRDAQIAPHPLTRRLPPGRRTERWWYSLWLFRRLLAAREPSLLIFHGPEFRDFITFALSSVALPATARTVGVFVMRREAWAIVGHRGLRAWLLEWCVRWMVRHGRFIMASDSRAAMDHWGAITGGGGLIVDIPTRAPPAGWAPRPRGGPVMGLIGGFRMERGAGVYERVIEACLAIPKAVVECHISEMVPDAPERRIAGAIAAKWEGHPRVCFHLGHLPASTFNSLLFDVDVIVLPYDVESYGPGTSGIMHEALAAGRIVVSTRIPWAVQTFDGHPNVVWLDTVNAASLEASLAIAARMAVRKSPQAFSRLSDDSFQTSWRTVIEAAHPGPAAE